MNKQKAGSVCAAKNCKNKRYNCNKCFFRFPSDPTRARTWAIRSNREDLLENVDGLHNSYRLCSDHFDLKMFTNKFCNRLKQNAIPTIFPSLEGCSKELPLDHSYCLPKLVDLADEEVPFKKICILNNTLLRPDEQNLNIKEENNIRKHKMFSDTFVSENTKSPQILSPSVSTQTSTKSPFNTPGNTKYRDKMRMLETENKALKESVEKLENKLGDVLENITFEQYQLLTFKFCNSVEIANFINIQVAQSRKLPKGRSYSKEFKNECLAIYFAGPKFITDT